MIDEDKILSLRWKWSKKAKTIFIML